MSKNLIQRIAVAAVAIPAILWISYQGGLWLAGMLTLFAIIAIIEYMHGEDIAPVEPVFWLGLATVIVTMVSIVPFIAFYPDDALSIEESRTLGAIGIFVSVAALAVFFIMSAMLFAIGKKSPAELFERHSRLFWGVSYVALLYPFANHVSRAGRTLTEVSGGDLLLFLFALLWVGDTAAMFGGMALGKHKLAPTVSPNKTVEGLVCGIVGAVVIGVIMFYWKLSALGLAHVIVLSIGCSVFGQLGDLVESMWKRSRGIKDSSALIPGHGGVLDRFDSLLFAAPFMYAYLTFVM